MEFKKRFKELREAKHYTQKDIADLLHVSTTTVNNWENGSRLPSPEKFERIADFFGVSIDYLYGREEKQPPQEAAVLDLAEKQPEYMKLLEAVQNVAPEDIELVYQMITRMSRKPEKD